MLAMAPALLPAAPRRLKGFEMDGHCAVVAHHDHWEDEATGTVRRYPATRHAHARAHASLPLAARVGLPD